MEIPLHRRILNYIKGIHHSLWFNRSRDVGNAELHVMDVAD
jgi:hypothetical protein